jgi:hypothetical protein
MTFASPWFGPLYLTAFAAGLIVITLSRRLAPNVAVALAAYATAVAALCAGLAVRGTQYDVSGEPFALAPAPIIVSVPAKLGAADGRDGELSVDVFANVVDPRGGVSSPLLLSERDSVVIAGWAFAPAEHARCAGVAALVDGRPFTGPYGLERPDVAAVFGVNHRFTGFRVVVPARAAGRGSHRVSVRCLGGAGHTYEGASTYAIKVRP